MEPIRLVSPERSQERIVEEIVDIPVPQILEPVQRRGGGCGYNRKGLTTTLDAEAVVSGARAVKHGARTREKFKGRWRNSWNAYEDYPGAGALEKSRASQARCPP